MPNRNGGSSKLPLCSAFFAFESARPDRTANTDTDGVIVFHRDWTTYFGRPHIHPVSGQPAAYPELHLVWREDKGTTDEQAFLGRLSTTTIHSDVRCVANSSVSKWAP